MPVIPQGPDAVTLDDLISYYPEFKNVPEDIAKACLSRALAWNEGKKKCLGKSWKEAVCACAASFFVQFYGDQVGAIEQQGEQIPPVPQGSEIVVGLSSASVGAVSFAQDTVISQKALTNSFLRDRYGQWYMQLLKPCLIGGIVGSPCYGQRRCC